MINFEQLKEDIREKNITEDTQFIDGNDIYMFHFEEYDCLCDEYGRNNVNEYLNDIREMVRSRVYKKLT